VDFEHLAEQQYWIITKRPNLLAVGSVAMIE